MIKTRLVLLVLAAVLLPGTAPAQQAAPNPDPPAAESQTEQKPTEPAIEQLQAKVIEVEGDVSHAPVGTSVLDAKAWTPVKVDDELPPDTQVRTGFRSHMTFRFGDDTVVMIERVSLASIDQYYKEAIGKTIRMGLGYGAVRGGSTETALRTDFIVDSPVATLSKRGTEGWRMAVEPYTGRFNVSLAVSGLVEAVSRATGQSRLVAPGEYASFENIGSMWVKQELFDRTVMFVAEESLTLEDLDFVAEHATGLGVLAPGGGAEMMALSGRDAAEFILDMIDKRRPGGRPDTMMIQGRAINRPEGNFGIGSTFSILTERKSRQAGRDIIPRAWKLTRRDYSQWRQSKAALSRRPSQ